jgi:hypothetical protein
MSLFASSVAEHIDGGRPGSMANVLLLQECYPSELQLLPCMDPPTLHSNWHSSISLLSTQALHPARPSTSICFDIRKLGISVWVHSKNMSNGVLSVPASAALQA